MRAHQPANYAIILAIYVTVFQPSTFLTYVCLAIVSLALHYYYR